MTFQAIVKGYFDILMVQKLMHISESNCYHLERFERLHNLAERFKSLKASVFAILALQLVALSLE